MHSSWARTLSIFRTLSFIYFRKIQKNKCERLNKILTKTLLVYQYWYISTIFTFGIIFPSMIVKSSLYMQKIKITLLNLPPLHVLLYFSFCFVMSYCHRAASSFCSILSIFSLHLLWLHQVFPPSCLHSFWDQP